MGGRVRLVILGMLGFVVTLAAAGCGGADGERAAVARATPEPSTAPTVPTTVAWVASPVDGMAGVEDARQVISVVTDGYGRVTGELVAYERQADGWHEVLGPWPAVVGRNGFAPPDEKREGDGRTPSGTFAFDFAFGILADPGAKLAYRQITSSAIVWDDDPASPRYNEWIDTAREAVGRDPEPMYNPPVYNYGAVIAYNAQRTPGLGSAIFLHVSRGNPTAGCVAVTQEQMVELLRWLDPTAHPRIVMGTRDTVSP